MKKFTKQEILELYGQVTLGEISFSQMVEIMNERAEEPKFKEGDFLHSDWESGNVAIICRKINGSHIYYHASKSKHIGLVFDKGGFWTDDVGFRLATESEKKELIDALAEVGKRWNAENLCVEDIPKTKFKKCDKVRIKAGVSSKTHGSISPIFVTSMDNLIGKELTVESYGNLFVRCYGYYFLEEWLEPYVEELKKGDWAIFWDFNKELASIGKYNQFIDGVSFPHKDHRGVGWHNAIQFNSIEQYEKLINGEL